MDKKLLKAAASFALNYKRVHGEALSVASLVAGMGAQEKVDKACARSTPDSALEKAARIFAAALGLVPSVAPLISRTPSEIVRVDHALNILSQAPQFKRTAHLAAEPSGLATAKHWQMILACAREVAGPMSDVWIEQARESGPGTLKAAILASKKSMGAFGDDFAKALRRHLLDNG